MKIREKRLREREALHRLLQIKGLHKRTHAKSRLGSHSRMRLLMFINPILLQNLEPYEFCQDNNF